MCLYKISLVGLLMNCASYSFGLNIFGDAGFSSFTYERCQRLCVYASACASFDWNKETRVCQLNRDSSERNENTHAVSINTINAKEGPCMKRPCSSLHVCVPVVSSTDYRCLPIGQTTTATTSATTAATSATTTTAEKEASTITTSTTTTAAAATETASTTTTAAAATETASTTTTAAATTTRSNKPCLLVNDSCTDGHCRCSIGCGFDELTKRCREMTVTECLELDNTFEEYTGHSIRGHNEPSSGPQNCEEKCISRNCSTYDRHANGGCNIRMVFWYDVDEEERKSDSSRTHCQRNCKTWHQP